MFMLPCDVLFIYGRPPLVTRVSCVIPSGHAEEKTDGQTDKQHIGDYKLFPGTLYFVIVQMTLSRATTRRRILPVL